MSDYMKEAERLLSEYGDAVSDAVVFAQDPAGYSMRMEEATRAALLAHIQRGAAPEGWKEATIAWEVCASIHREYAKKKDPFFTTRQADFVRHTEAARAAMLAAAPAPDQFRDAAKMMAELLAHLQRGAVPEGWQLVPKEPTPEMLAGGWGYWLNVMAPGKQRDTAAKEYTAMLAAAPAPDQFRDAAENVAAPAGVPMPKPVAYGFGNTAITGHTNRLMMVRIDIPGDDQYAGAFWLPLVLADEAHTYGVACRAAGEAAGYARGLADERERICAAIKAEDDYCVTEGDYMLDSDDCIRVARGTWERPDYALRGEVKP